MIVIFDDYCPFCDNSSFLSTELTELSKFGEKIVIYPFTGPDNIAEVSKNIPQNIILRSVAYKKNSIAKTIVCAVKSFYRTQFLSDLGEILQKGITIRKIYSAYIATLKTELYFENIKDDLKKYCKDNEEIIFYSYWMYLNACVASRCKLKYRFSKFITRAHGYDLYEERSEISFLPARKVIFNSADAIYPVSKQGEQYLCRKYSYLEKSKVTSIYLGTFDHGINNISSKKKRIVSCSNIVPVKRINLLVSALSLIKDIEIEWVHYGDGSSHDEIQAMADLLLSSNIRYSLVGEIPNKELMKVFKKQEISYLINVSESEGLPVSIMESMSFGIPVIATDVGGVNEIVENKKNGYLINKDVSPEELAYCIRFALNIPEDEYKELKTSARVTWENKFDACKNFASFYEKIHNI